jgi:hypothetical protein
MRCVFWNGRALLAVMLLACAGDDAPSGAPANSGGMGGAGGALGGDGGATSGGQGGSGGRSPELDASSSIDASALDATDMDANDASDALDAASDAGDAGDALMPIIVAAGANHSLHLSIDEGQTFCEVQREPADPIGDGFDNPHLFRHIAFANGRFVAGSWRVVLASSNGHEWQDVTDGDDPVLGNWVGEIDFGNGAWVGVGGYGGVMRSNDLVSWQKLDGDWGDAAFRSLAFGNGMFVASRDGSGWWSSSDGSAWAVLDAAASGPVVFHDADFVSDPGYRSGRGVRLRSGGGGIELAADRDDASYTPVTQTQDGITDFAFGFAPVRDYASARVTSPQLAACLGL